MFFGLATTTRPQAPRGLRVLSHLPASTLAGIGPPLTPSAAPQLQAEAKQNLAVYAY